MGSAQFGAERMVAVAFAMGVGLVSSAGCTRQSKGEPPVDASYSFDAYEAPDAGFMPDAGCVPPWNMDHPVVYAHAVLRPTDPLAGNQEFLAIVDTTARRISRWVPLTCEWSTSPEHHQRDQYLDMAVSFDGKIVMAGANAFYSFDPDTGVCTVIRQPEEVPNPDDPDFPIIHMVETPNNLTFVPRGVLDPHKEVMAAFGFHYLDQDDPRGLYEAGFMMYDPANGIPIPVYQWPETVNVGISGDLVVVMDGCSYVPRTFVTMTGPRERTHCHWCQEGETPGVDCGDCLYEFDIRTGTHVREITVLPVWGVYGLAMWGDTIYGFSEGDYFHRGNGKIIAIRPGETSARIEELPIDLPEGFSSAHFMGAGSSTSAPVLF